MNLTGEVENQKEKELELVLEDEQEREFYNKYKSQIHLILRQTNYSQKEAIMEFKKNADVELVIKKYYGIASKKLDNTVNNLNQQIYSEIRNFLDNKN